MDQDRARPISRSKLLYAAAAVALAVAAGIAYVGHREVAALRQQVSSCGDAGCDTLADQARSLKSQLAATQGLQGRVVALETELAGVKDALRAAEGDRDRLAAEVAACGADGCQGLADRLARAEKDVANLTRRQRALREEVAALREDNRSLRDQLAKEFSSETGQRLGLLEIARIGPFDIGSHALGDGQLVDLEERLRPYLNTPLLVVGIADHRPYKGPSAELKQLGLMLARAQLIQSKGYEVYYQVRQNDPRAPESRGVIVYRMSMQSAPAAAAPSPGSLSMAVPSFYSAK